LTVGQLARDKKANDICILDLRKLSPVTDYFVVCTAEADVHVKAVTDFITRTLKEKGVAVRRIEGRGNTGWVVIDYITVIVHIFLAPVREHYSLERLWGDAPKTIIPD
jgi:ribosome-associated protein